MSFDWLEYLTLAQGLANQTTQISTQEARLRSAISRAYYAAFRKARNHLRDKENKSLSQLTQGNTHQIVIDLFEDLYRQRHDKRYGMIAQFLRDLRSMRNKADYNDLIPSLTKLAQSALLQAETVISWLNSL